MCGIAGIIEFEKNKSINLNELMKMSDAIFSRGPDDDGTYINKDKKVGFSFRRLSIIDLKLGRQPMSDLHGDVWIVYNGEIYNHVHLRRILTEKGYRFKTKCDTEVIIYAYKEWGEKCVHKFRGMFSFAIWDNENKILFLARDRLGIKPLYYYYDDKNFIFSSEIKSIIASGRVNKTIDERSLYHYLTIAVSPAPDTMFKDIKKLEPGHTLTIGLNGNIKKKEYWNPAPNTILKNLNETEIISEVRRLLRESIKIRMMSDVPFGVFLSGGVDSSLNVALMNEFTNGKVRTFSVAVSGDSLSDELSEARYVSKYFDTDHHELSITQQEFIDFLPILAEQQDEPLADPVSVPLFYVSKLARQNGTPVIQVGEGADEIFSGYELYAKLSDFNKNYYKPFSQLPNFIKRLTLNISKYILPEKKFKYIESATYNRELFLGGANIFSEIEKNDLIKGNINFNTYNDIILSNYEYYDKVNPNGTFLDRAIYLELKHRLPELLLMRVDKMAMGVSVETRVPFLDHKLVEFAQSIPDYYKYRDGTAKYILKKAARGIIPDQVIDRKKIGFCGSASNLISGPVIDYAESNIMDSEWMKSYFNTEKIYPIFDEHRNNQKDHGMKIFNLLNLSLWESHWFR